MGDSGAPSASVARPVEAPVALRVVLVVDDDPNRPGDRAARVDAASLGYADQSHFARDFKLTVGQTPRVFAREAAERRRRRAY